MNQACNQKYKENEANIRSAFLTLLQETDFTSVTIQKICEKAQINRSTFYRHHEDIYALLLAMQKDIFSEFLEKFRSYSHPQGYISAESFVVLITHIHEHRNFYLAYLRCRPWVAAYEKKAEDSLWESYFTPMFQSYGVENPRHMRYYYNYFHAGFTSCIRSWLEDGCIESPKEMADLIWKYAFHETDFLSDLPMRNGDVKM